MADLLSFLAHRSATPVVLVGQGTGALLALLAASRAPDQIAGVFAAQPVTGIDLSIVERVRAEVAAHRLIPDASAAASAFTFGARWRPQVLTHAVETSLMPVAGGLAFRYRPEAVVETEEALAADFSCKIAVSCPVLLVRGGESAIVTDTDLARLAERIPGAELAALPRADHRLSQDDPEGFARLLDDFLVRHCFASRR